jgi:hypothetical protein
MNVHVAAALVAYQALLAPRIPEVASEQTPEAQTHE